MGSHDRVRQSRRQTVHFPATIEARGARHLGYSTDMSFGGMGLKVPCTLAVGQTIQVRLNLPSGQMDVAGHVVWFDGFSQVPRLGIRFVSLRPEMLTAIHQCLAR